MRTRLLAVGVAVVAVLSSATGCSSGAKGRPHAAPLSATPPSASPGAATTDPKSARITALMRRLAAWSDDNKSVTATEIVDFDGRKVRYDGLFTWGAGSAMDVRSPTAQLGLQKLNSSDKTEIVLLGDSYYFRVDPQPSGPLKDRHWMRTPVPQSAAEGSPTAQGLQASPENGLGMLVDGTGWTDLGINDLDGTVGTRYMGTVTRAALSADTRLARATGGSPAALLAGTDTAELDVWVDAHGKPIRYVLTLAAGRTVAVDLWAFGGPRTITPPAPSDTVNVKLVSGRPVAA
jgi:hypothetical protein